MNRMLEEIKEIPSRAEEIYTYTKKLKLPTKVPYLGMGSSYFAALTMKHAGLLLKAEIASEYSNYLSIGEIQEIGVLISQSGRSTEALRCRDLFEEYIAITNDLKSPICSASNVVLKIPMLAGREEYSATKTYLNTLICLYNGFGLDCRAALNVLSDNMNSYLETGTRLAEEIFELYPTKNYQGIFLLANGPNYPTMCNASLILSETCKIIFQALPLSQYYHGYKETAENSIVIFLKTQSPDSEYLNKVKDSIEKAGAKTIVVEELYTEHFSPLLSIMPFNFMAWKLAELLGIKKPFVVGEKISVI